MGNKKVPKVLKLSEKEFRDLVSISDSILEVKLKLGYSSSSGGAAEDVKNRIAQLSIDTSHFTMGKNTRKYLGNPKYELQQILVENSTYLNRSMLKKRLVSSGLMEYKCIECDNVGIWNGKKLSLQLDHINGIPNDNRIENLRILCPNCHSQTETYSGKSSNKK